eukprot:scaffold69091_cov60-Phaeocystis_antarctica.AAC.2
MSHVPSPCAAATQPPNHLPANLTLGPSYRASIFSLGVSAWLLPSEDSTTITCCRERLARLRAAKCAFRSPPPSMHSGQQ